MNRLKIIFLFSILSVSINHVYSNDTLSLNNFLEVISLNYPLIKKANLFDEFTEAYNLKGKGTFDPKINSSFQTKSFSGTNYFRTWQTEAKIPTKYPIDLSLGYERNDGSFLNAEGTVPNNGLVYGTFNLTVLRGLMFDEQRYSVQLAELNGIKGQIEKNTIKREILIQAILSYLEWSAADYKNEILNNYLIGIKERHLNIIELFINGDRPAIDTIESRLNVNTAQKILLKSSQELITKRQKVDLFLWNNEGLPQVLQKDVHPESIDNTLDQINTLSIILSPEFDNDPLIQKIENQIQQIELKTRLEKENLKPQLDLKYNTILDLGKNDLNPNFNINNYKYGINLELPILTRKSRGEIRLNETLIAQNRLDKKQYKQTLLNKYYNLTSNKYLQVDVIDITLEKVENSQALYEAEQLKFELGESSVFMLNQREMKLLESNIELIKSYLQYGEIIAELYYLRLGQV